MKRFLLISATIVVIALLCTGCGGSSSEDTLSGGDDALIGTWTRSSEAICNELGIYEITLAEDGGADSYSTDCRYRGTWLADGTSLIINYNSSTCGDDPYYYHVSYVVGDTLTTFTAMCTGYWSKL